ncbi:N-acetylmuramoyl-L-alanine amidase [Faecalibacter rhinopitheci]|uniref:N-acetylmuramoyl-L-alanine amidase n=1 Tax=Faecalibacter rhinopitheci TaxID=2779678 RepID=A0A8J7G5P8_9FLAO|nr:N-acetylmuramoyl-L-alanine amidase [Faecalibacter rhinopitheci]MBF0597152.1 N-acetylmuramoyl-L-alanine amidase [Faecalibacter rhinopitheci]MBQ0148485.1 N-acetylmuramoyl-L-alanine amidase [Candidatus Onthonaster equi]
MNVKGLVFLGVLSIFSLSSCGSSKNIPQKVVTKIIRDTVVMNSKTEKPEMARAAKLENYKINSDNYPAIGQDERIRFLVLHYTALDNPTSMRVLTQQEVSSHYLINDIDDDQIHLLVDETKRAWHAGVSKWKNLDNLNFTSIGIEIVNKGYTTSNGVQTHYPYPEYQFKKVGELTKDIIKRYKISPVNVIAHSDIAPGRKHDPGPLFPWKRLYDEYGVGAWYEEADKQAFIQIAPFIFDSEFVIKETQTELKKYGYEIQVTGVWDEQSKKVLQAFQYHFTPLKTDGILNLESWAVIKALNKKYNP